MQVLGPECTFPTLYKAVSFVKATQLKQAELAGAAPRTAAKMEDIFGELSALHAHPNPTLGAGGSSRDTTSVNGVTRTASPSSAAQRFGIASRGTASAQGVAESYQSVGGSRGGGFGAQRGLQRPSAVPMKALIDERTASADERRAVLLAEDGESGARFMPLMWHAQIVQAGLQQRSEARVA